MLSSLKTRLAVSQLESREVLSATLVNGLLTVTGTADLDTIELFGRGTGVVEVIAPGVSPLTRFTGVTAIRVDGGAGGDNIKFENVTAPVVANGGLGDDNMQYLAERAGAVSVTMNGGEGNDSIQVDLKLASQAAVTANTIVDGGAGNDKLQIQIVSEANQLTAATTVNDVSGDDELLMQVDQKSQLAGSSAAVRVSVNLGTGMDKMTNMVESESRSTNYSLTFRGTGGMKEIGSSVFIDGAAVTASVAYDIATGADMDKIELNTLSQATQSMTQTQAINTGAGNDGVKINLNQLGSAAVTVGSNITLGDGNDEFEFGFAGDSAPLTLNGVMTGGLGDDKMLVKVTARTLTNNLQLLGGGGTDLVEFIR